MGNAEGHYNLDDKDEELEGGAMHEVQLVSTGFLSVAGVTAYHTSVVVDDKEFLFDSLGIMVAPPLWSHMAAHSKDQPPSEDSGRQTDATTLGRSAISGIAMAKTLRPHFMKDTYDILYKNCNHFTDCALYVLLGSRLPGKFSRGERLLTATDPVSTGIMNRAFKSFMAKKTGVPCDINIYETNPRAADFSVRKVIAALDDSAEEDEDEATEPVQASSLHVEPGVGQSLHQQRSQGSAFSVQVPAAQGLFTLVLEKAAHEKWAMNLECSLQTRLLVVNVFDGVVARHNAFHPDKRIEVGDFIERVNSEDKSALAMAEIIRSNNRLQVVVRKSWYNKDLTQSSPSLSQTMVTGTRAQSTVRFLSVPHDSARLPAQRALGMPMQPVPSSMSISAPIQAQTPSAISFKTFSLSGSCKAISVASPH